MTYMEISTFMQEDLRADVLRTCEETPNYFGCRFWTAEVNMGIEWYKDYSESYVEDIAENYVMGIKKCPE